MAFLFQENQRHGTDGHTDEVQHLMRPPGEDHVTISVMQARSAKSELNRTL